MVCTPVLLSVLLLIFAAGCGDSNPAGSTGPSPGGPQTTFTLAGHVSDAATAASLRDVTLTIMDGRDAGRETRTGPDGAFRFADVPLGGFTLRAQHDGYDTVFRGLNFGADTTIDIQMQREQQSLSGTWAGSIVHDPGGTGSVTEISLTQSNATLEPLRFASAPFAPGYMFFFTGNVEDTAAIGSTTRISGTFTTAKVIGLPRDPITCSGSGPFTGTVNWTTLTITAPRIVYACDGQAVRVTLSLARQN